MSTHEEQPESPGPEGVVQRVVLRVAEHHQGADAGVVQRALAEALAEAGLPEQPQRWMASTAEEIAHGRVVITDPAVEQDVHRWRDQGDTPDADST